MTNRNRPARRTTQWVDTLLNTGVASGGKSETTLLATASVQDTRTWTLVRTILCMTLSYTVHDAGEGSQTVDIGILTAAQEAFAAGILADPEAAGDFPQRGWVYRCRYRVFGFAADQAAVDRILIERDIRSQRKIEREELILSISNSANIGAASAITVTGIVRCLFLE